MQFIVIYRQHSYTFASTRYIGPFYIYEEAMNAMAKLPPLDRHIPSGIWPNAGVRFIQKLEPKQ